MIYVIKQWTNTRRLLTLLEPLLSNISRVKFETWNFTTVSKHLKSHGIPHLQIIIAWRAEIMPLTNISDLLVTRIRTHDYTLHCWKKKRDFLIICSKVGGFLSLTVDGNEYFIGWKENLVHKYHQKWLPIICKSR